MTFVEAALSYRERGWGPLPLKPQDKVPQWPWRMFQTQLPSPWVIQRWWALEPESNVGLVTGAVSGLVVVDVDLAKVPDAGGQLAELFGGELPPSPLVRTGSGGLHLYFAHPGEKVGNRAGLLPGVDVRGDGGYVVAPPSIHPDGGAYKWEIEAPLAPVPAALLTTLAAPIAAHQPGRGGGHGPLPGSDFRRIPNGQRNATLFRRACGMRAAGWEEEWIEQELQAVNVACCAPPLDMEEVARIAASAARYAPK